MIKPVFPYKHNDIVSFPDTESEYVDVGFGEHMGMKVAENTYPQLCRVVKCGKGFRLEIYPKDEYTYSETFRRGYSQYGKGHYSISLREYLDEFGDYKDLKYVCTKEEFDNPEKYEEEYEDYLSEYEQTEEGMMRVTKLVPVEEDNGILDEEDE